MKSIITEELRLRKRICDYALTCGNMSQAARRYHTSRQQVSLWLKRYDGTIESLFPKSRRPHAHPNQHTTKELELLKRVSSRYRHEGLAEVYVQARKRGYKRSYGSMVRNLKKHEIKPPKRAYKVRSKWVPDVVTQLGEKVQIDIKYVPKECLCFDTKGISYYQITAIDEFSRKRVLKIVDGKHVNHTAAFLLELENALGFKVQTVQTDNGSEFTNAGDGSKKSLFEKTLEELDINYKKTRPYSPWQNGKVERSHRVDGERFYSREFTSLKHLEEAISRYMVRYNNIAQKVLGFKSPNEIVNLYMGNSY